MGTSRLNRVLRSFVPRGSTPRVHWLHFALEDASSYHTEKREGEEQSSIAQAEIEFARQGIPFGQFVQTQLGFPQLLVFFSFLIQQNCNKITNGNIQKKISGKTKHCWISLP